jgi:hypothetical protein
MKSRPKVILATSVLALTLVGCASNRATPITDESPATTSIPKTVVTTLCVETEVGVVMKGSINYVWSDGSRTISDIPCVDYEREKRDSESFNRIQEALRNRFN